MSDNSFVDFVVDQLSEFEAITFRKMFGGYGLYARAKIFAIIAYDELYLKGNEETEKFYVEQGSEKFAYDGKGKIINMNYWRVPTEILEDKDELQEWFKNALKSQS